LDAVAAAGGEPAPAAEPEPEPGPDAGVGTSGEQPAEQPGEHRIPKERLDKEVAKRRQAEAETAETRSELQQLRDQMAAQAQQLQQLQQQPPAPAHTEPDEDDDLDPTAKTLRGVQNELQQLRQEQQQQREEAQRQQRLSGQAAQLRDQIGQACKAFPQAAFDEVVREMRLDHALTPVQAARVVHDREAEKERAVLERYSVDKGKVAAATRRPAEAPTNPLGTDVAPAPDKPQPLTEAQRRQRLDAAMAKHKPWG